jgi:Methyl-accepting chemotaxis protein (MCP) signalling domain
MNAHVISGVDHADDAECAGALTRMRLRASANGAPMDGADASRTETHHQTERLAQEINELKNLAVAFERWHQDMIGLTAQNRSMHSTGEDLVQVARNLIMVALNAAIEAARSGQSARGFVVVAAEVRSLALRAQELTKSLSRDLNKSELITTATFQDIQAGGKMMMAAVSGLESLVNKLQARVD